MKNKTLQILLQHNRRILLLIFVLITTSQGVWGYDSGCYIVGSWDSWFFWHSLSNTGDEVTINLSNASYEYHFNARRTWDSGSGSHEFGCGGCSVTSTGDVTVYHSGETYVKLITTVAGNYKFKLKGWDNDNPIITVTFPDPPTPDTFDVAGNGTVGEVWCCGANWSANGCAMTGNSSSYPVYKTFSNVPVNDNLQFKVTKNDSWDTSYGKSEYSPGKSTLSPYTKKSDDGSNIKLSITDYPHNITVYYDGENVYVETEVACTAPSSVTIGSVATQELKCCVAEPKNGNGSGVSVTATTSPSGSGNQYQWTCSPNSNVSFTNGNTSNPTVTFTREGNYTLTVGTGCGNYNTTDTENVTVIPPSTIYVAGPLFCTASEGCNAWCQNTNTMTRTDNGDGTYTYTSVLTALYDYNHASNKNFTVRTSSDASKSAYIISKNFTSASYTGITTSGSGNYDLRSTVAFSATDRVRLTVVYNSSTANYSMTLEKVKVCSAGNNDITFSTGDNIMCVGDNPTAIAPSDAIVPASATVSWVSHSPLVLSVNSTTGEVNALTSGSADIVYRITDNAVVCAEKKISTAVRPVPSQPTISGETVVCSGTEDLSYNITSGTAGAVYTWSIDNKTWTRTSASATTTPAIFTAGTGDATITATPTLTTSGKTCTGTAGTIDVDVNTTPSISVSSPAGTIYDYVPVTLSSASVSDWSYTGTNITGYFSSEAANGAVFKGQYTGGGSSGTATISAEGTNGCIGTLDITINKDSESCD